MGLLLELAKGEKGDAFLRTFENRKAVGWLY